MLQEGFSTTVTNACIESQLNPNSTWTGSRISCKLQLPRLYQLQMASTLQQKSKKGHFSHYFPSNYKFQVRYKFQVQSKASIKLTFSANVETVTSRGADYADRENIHQTSDVTTEEVITQWDQSHPYGNVVYQ